MSNKLYIILFTVLVLQFGYLAYDMHKSVKRAKDTVEMIDSIKQANDAYTLELVTEIERLRSEL